MTALHLLRIQRQKEDQGLRLFLLSSLLVSVVGHGVMLTWRIYDWRSPLILSTFAEEAEEMDVTITEVPREPDPYTPATLAVETDVSSMASLPDLHSPVPTELVTALPMPVDMPSETNDSPSSAVSEPTTVIPTITPTAMPSLGDIPLPTGATSTTPNVLSSGEIGEAHGSGIGQGKESGSTRLLTTTEGTMTVRGGNDDISNRGSGSQRTMVVPAKPREPVCLSCPKPKFNGTEASPRVDLKIRPDGSVEVRLRQSSGDATLDRATLEAMSQWRFDPQTVPDGGVQKRIKVTYEVEGSEFQRRNQQRRQQLAEQQRQQQLQREPKLTGQSPQRPTILPLGSPTRTTGQTTETTGVQTDPALVNRIDAIEPTTPSPTAEPANLTPSPAPAPVSVPVRNVPTSPAVSEQPAVPVVEPVAPVPVTTEDSISQPGN